MTATLIKFTTIRIFVSVLCSKTFDTTKQQISVPKILKREN